MLRPVDYDREADIVSLYSYDGDFAANQAHTVNCQRELFFGPRKPHDYYGDKEYLYVWDYWKQKEQGKPVGGKNGEPPESRHDFF